MISRSEYPDTLQLRMQALIPNNMRVKPYYIADADSNVVDRFRLYSEGRAALVRMGYREGEGGWWKLKEAKP